MTGTQVAALVLLPVVGAMIVLKNDQQIVHILEGYLFKNHKDTAHAKAAYKKRLPPYSFAAIVIGFALATAGAILLGLGQPKFISWVLLVIGVVFAVVGIWQRIMAFQAAARDLKELPTKHQERKRRAKRGSAAPPA